MWKTGVTFLNQSFTNSVPESHKWNLIVTPLTSIFMFIWCPSRWLWYCNHVQSAQCRKRNVYCYSDGPVDTTLCLSLVRKRSSKVFLCWKPPLKIEETLVTRQRLQRLRVSPDNSWVTMVCFFSVHYTSMHWWGCENIWGCSSEVKTWLKVKREKENYGSKQLTICFEYWVLN